MQKFDLSLWLQDKSRKVVTRQGNPVRIICTDRKHTQSWPIVALESYYSGEFVLYADDKGRTDLANENIHDLFFADEKEQDEFENTMFSFAHAMFDHLLSVTKEIDIKEWKDKLLDLARKELEKSIEDGAIEFAKSYMEDVNPSFEKVKESEELWKWKMSCLRGINKAYTQGKQDAFKDLPKWKKVDSNPPKVQYNLQGKRLYKDGEYYIELNDLETLPKEE